MVGFSRKRKAERTFRLSRIQGAVKTKRGRGPDFKAPADFDIEAFTERQPWEYEGGKEEWAEILFQHLLNMMGAYSGQCAVLKPKWLRQQAIAQLRELRARYD